MTLVKSSISTVIKKAIISIITLNQKTSIGFSNFYAND